ncbi:MAG: hypothetical protein HPY76_13020, partial [Anaerolineae bacterium]|nr:hypothetical protein [Anaerolineae bacterium]
LWGAILNWGEVPPFHDWAEINLARLAFLQDAVRSGQLPLHMADASALRMLTDRFMALPDVILSPDLLLLAFLSLEQYILVHWLLCYTLGFLALVWLRVRHAVSLPLLVGVFLLFNFNGHIVGHLTVGHYTWGGYFLLPWLVLLCLELRTTQRRWLWIAAVALLMLGIWLQGSFHQFVIGLIFLVLFSLASIRRAGSGLVAAGFSLLLALPRILPATLILGGSDTESLGGYQLIRYFKDSAVVPRPAAEWLPYANYYSPLGWWEFNLYLGWAGVILLGLLGLGWLLAQVRARRLSPLWLPLVIMFFLSIRNHYDVYLGWVPLFAGLRVSTRIIILPMLAVIFAGAGAWGGWLPGLPRRWRLAANIAVWALVGWQAYDLLPWALRWGVDAMAGVFPLAAVDLTSKVIANHPDPLYTQTLTAGVAGALLSLLFLGWMVVRERRQLKWDANKDPS